MFNFFRSWFFFFPPTYALCPSVLIHRSGTAKNKKFLFIYVIYFPAHEMENTFSHTMHISTIPFFYGKFIQHGMIFMIAIHKSNGAGKYLLEAFHIIYIILVPDISGITCYNHDIRWMQCFFFCQPKQRYKGSVFITGNKNSSIHFSIFTTFIFCNNFFLLSKLYLINTSIVNVKSLPQ